MMNYSSTLNPSFWLHFWFILFRENVQILAEKNWNTNWKEYQRDMATTGLQLLGFILGVFAWAGMIATCASPEWRKNSVGGTALDQHKRFFPIKNIIMYMKNQVWWSVGSMRTNAERKYQLRKLQCFLHRASRYDFSSVFIEIRIDF